MMSGDLMKFNFLLAVAILVCILTVAMALVVITASGEKPASLDRWGTLSGIVTDKFYNGVPGVMVTLYEAKLESATSQYVNVKKYDSPDNPMKSNDNANIGAIGVYTYYRLPLGVYIISGEKDGYQWQAIANVTEGTTTLNLNNPDYPSSTGAAGAPPRWSTVSGMVVDRHKNGIPGAIVTMYEVVWDGETYKNIRELNSSINPQYTVSDPAIAAIGTYTYFDVPLGTYNLTAEKDGHLWFALVNATQPGTYTNNIAIPDYLMPVESPSSSLVTDTISTGAPWFTLCGFVTDKNQNGIPGAKVTVYEAVINNSSGGFDNVKVAATENNPQLTNSDPSIAAIGTHTFYKVPQGYYNVTAEKDGHIQFAIVNATSAVGTRTLNINMPDYIQPAGH